MSETKTKMKEIIDAQPEDATYRDILRELAFENMVKRGLDDVREKRVMSNEEMYRTIRSWRKNMDTGGRKLAERYP